MENNEKTNIEGDNLTEKVEQKTSISFIATCVLVLIAFFAGFYFNDNVWESKIENSEKMFSRYDLTLLWEVINELSDSYVDPEKIQKQELIYGIIGGAVSSLDDPHTVFLDPQQSKNLSDDISGMFTGVGIQVGMKDDKLRVIAPIKGTPAERAGVLSGDIIFQVDGNSIAGMAIDDVIKQIKGEKGTKVVLTVSRANEVQDIEIIRDVIKVPTIDVSIENKEEKKIAHLEIFHFSGQVFSDFKRYLNDLNNADGIILDLRNNPGGLVDQTKLIASYFLDKDEVIFIERDKFQHENTINSIGYADLVNKPIVILINPGSASASEILAGALRDNNKTLIIGETSFGKGSVQRVRNFTDGSSLKVTTHKWFTPNGVAIQDVGIVPDIEVERTVEDYKAEKDPQLDRAYEEIIKLIK